MAKKMAVAIVPSSTEEGVYQHGIDSYRKVSGIKEAAKVYSEGIADRAVPVHDLPDERNISGRVQDEPDHLYAIEDQYGDYLYFGLWET